MTMPGQDYASAQDRYNYLKALVNNGVPIAPDAQKFINDFEAGQGQQQPQSQYSAPQAQTAQDGGLNVVPGSDFVLQSNLFKQQNILQTQAEAAAKQLASQQIEAQKALERMRQQHDLELAAANHAFDAQQQEANRNLQRELQAGNISNQQFMQSRDLAQRESEFARDIALRQLTEQHQNEINQAQLQINKLSEMRQERELQARLAANPTDFVAYEFYKRMLGGQPTQMGAGQDTTKVDTTKAPTSQAAWDQAQTQAQNMLGIPYTKAPPAYSDQALQSVLGGIQGTGAPPLAYNPNLSGTGVFGAQIQAPNQMSRAQFQNLSPNELGILKSFLSAGIDMGGGQRASIDPEDYINQIQKSMVPTINSQNTPTTQYT